jgi:hypothetical protein
MNTPHVPDHVVFTELDAKEGVLVDLNAKRYYTLNETACRVWRSLEQRRTAQEIVSELTDVYDVTPEHAAASVERLFGDLATRQLLAPSPA